MDLGGQKNKQPIYNLKDKNVVALIIDNKLSTDDAMQLTHSERCKLSSLTILILDNKLSVQEARQLPKEQHKVLSLIGIQKLIVENTLSIDDAVKLSLKQAYAHQPKIVGVAALQELHDTLFSNAANKLGLFGANHQAQEVVQTATTKTDESSSEDSLGISNMFGSTSN